VCVVGGGAMVVVGVGVVVMVAMAMVVVVGRGGILVMVDQYRQWSGRRASS
jgi:hypothetical protein